MGRELNAEAMRLAWLQYWNEQEVRVLVEALRRSSEARVAFGRRYGIHHTRLSRWARQMEGRAEEPVLFHPLNPAQRVWGGPIEIEMGRDYRVRVAGGCRTRDLQRVLGVLRSGFEALARATWSLMRGAHGHALFALGGVTAQPTQGDGGRG